MTGFMPEDLRHKVEGMTAFQRSYCEYRARGLSQSVSASKAGSNAADKEARSRVGYQIEQLDGAKDYIVWLQQQRAKTAVIDHIEVIDMLRKVYDAAFVDKKFKEANVSAHLIG